MKNLFLGLLLAGASAFVFTACDKDDDDQKNLVELAQATANLSTLVEAVNYAELGSVLSNESQKYTVFAPTNAAFTALLSSLGVSKLTDLDKATVKQLLLYHVVAGSVKSTDLTDGYVKTAATFGTTTSALSLLVGTSPNVTLNKDVKVTTANVEASNGIVHIVDKVIALPTVVTHAVNNPNFSTLVAALTRPDLGVDYVSVLSGTGPFTVFAPTNAAFTALLADLGISSLNDIDAATLNAVLQYHVVNGANVLSTQLTDEQEVTTFGGGKFKVDLTGGAKIVDAGGRIANIAVVDVQANNGVVHVIDKVIRP